MIQLKDGQPVQVTRHVNKEGKEIFFATTHQDATDATILYDAMILGVRVWQEQRTQGQKPTLIELYVAPEEKDAKEV